MKLSQNHPDCPKFLVDGIGFTMVYHVLVELPYIFEP
jgi:hypothetical protein